MAFDPQGATLASGCGDNTVKLWEARSGKLLRTLQEHRSWIRSVTFDPHGGTLASGSEDQTVKLWEARSGKLLRTLEGHIVAVDFIAFSADGYLLASKSRDHTIRLWSCETWETVAVIPVPTRANLLIPSLAFHPTLPVLAATSSELDAPEHEWSRLIHLWELDLDVLLGKRRLARPTAPVEVSVQHRTAKVTRRHAYHCAKCRSPFEDRVVKLRLEARKKQLLCPICEAKTPLVNLLAAPTAASTAVAERMDANAKAGRRRITAEWVIKAKEAEGKYDVFLSHNSKDKAAVEAIARQLKSVGIRPWLDKWDLAPGDAITDKLEWAIKNVPCAALFFGPADIGKWHILEIRAYLERWAGGDARLVPVILPDAPSEPEIPVFVRQTLWVDMRTWRNEGDDGFYRFVCGILGKSPGDSPRMRFSARDVMGWQDYVAEA